MSQFFGEILSFSLHCYNVLLNMQQCELKFKHFPFCNDLLRFLFEFEIEIFLQDYGEKYFLREYKGPSNKIRIKIF